MSAEYTEPCKMRLYFGGMEKFRREFPDFDAAKAARETQNAWENFAAHRGTPDE